MHLSSRTPFGRFVLVLSALLLLVASSTAFAQLITATSYPFTASTGVALEDMSTGTTQLVGPGLDDTASAVTNIGFEFYFASVRQTQFSVNANGLMRLGATAVSTAFDNSTGFASTTNAPKIAPYFEDLCTGTNGRVHFKVVGTAPNRKLVVEWQNMQITRGAGCAGAGNGTFQVWLFETTGAVQFVYGAIQAGVAADAGHSVGLQAGAATNFASVTTGAGTVSYATANNTQLNAIPAGTSFTFAPVAPAAPTGLNFTAITPVGMTLNWTDNSSNEAGFQVLRSDDGGATYVLQTQTAANVTTFPQTGLTPNTTYFFRIIAVGDGSLSTVLQGSQATAPAGNIASAASGLWSNPATWQGGVVPTAGDNVTITAGQTVTVDVAAAAFSLTVPSGSVVDYEATTARTLAVGGNVSIAAGGTITAPATGTVTTHVLSVGGNLTNDGTLDLSTNGDTAAVGLTFTGAANTTFGGSGAVNDVRTVTVNKGTSFASTVELLASSFTVRGVTTDVAGWLTLTSGTFKLSGTFAGTSRVFATATYTIPAAGGFWLNNPNYTVVGQAGGTTTVNNGLLRVSTSTFNIGVGAGDGMGGTTGTFIVDGGTINSTGRIDPQGAVTWNQSAGTVNVGTVGNTRSNFGTFELFSTASSFTMSGGTINVVQPSTGATKVDFDIRSATFSITGGQVFFGAAPAPAGSTYIDTGGFIPTFTINTGMTLNINNAAVFFRGATITNNGAITATGANARFDFAGVVPMTYGGTGVFGTAATPFAGVGISANSTSLTTLNAPIVVNRVNLFTGGFVNSNQITLGNGGASTTVVQTGSTGLTVPGGNFDVSPNHNQGTGGQIVIYAFEPVPRTTGVEINPTRILTSMSVDQPNTVTIAGGNLTLASTAAAATLTNGRVITGSNTLALSSPTATITRTNGFIDGNLRKAYAAAGNKTFEVGSANGFSPVAINVTAATFPADVTARAVQGPFPGIAPPGKALQRHWALGAPAGTTADLTFTYLDPADIPGTATEANFVVYRNDGGTLTNLGGTITTAANTANVTGVTAFAEFTLAEPGATINFVPTISAVGVTRRAGDAVASATIANVNDVEDPETALSVTVNGGATATVNNVTVDTIATSAAGVVTANVVAACGATDAAFTLRVTDSGTLFAESTLNVTVQPNLPPQLSYPAATAAVFGQSLNVNPATGPSDSGSITGIVVQSNGTYTGGSSVNGAGVVALTSAAPVGSHTIVIRATDNCSVTTDANLVLNVGKAATTTTITTDNPDPSNVGQNVLVQWTFTVQAPGAGTPTGNMTVTDGTDSCVAAASAGQCTLALSTSGLRTLTATYAGDANFLTSSDTEGHTVNGGTDLSITKTSNLSQVATGLVQYTVVATNAGPVAVTGATVTDTLPAVISGATWTCTGSGSGTCTGSGNGNINQSVNLPVGASVTFAISGTVSTNPLPGFFSNTATVASSAAIPDTNPANNSATVNDAVVLFRNGFEDGGGIIAQVVMPGFGGNLRIDTADVMRNAVDDSAQDVALFAIGDQLALVSARRIGGEAQVRVLQRDANGTWHAGPWAAVLPQQSVSLVWSSNGTGTLQTGVQVD